MVPGNEGVSETTGQRKIRVRVFRCTPIEEKDHRWAEYEVPVIEGASVSNILEYIRCNIDRSLAYYLSCRIGKCQGCLVKVNGQVRRACTEPARGNMTIEPLDKGKVVKDLITESSGKGLDHV